MILINFLYQDIPSVGKADHFCAAPHFPDLWTIWIKYAHDCQLGAGPALFMHTLLGRAVKIPRGDDDEDESVDRDINNSNSPS